MPDEPRDTSPWTEAAQGLYGLTLDDLALVILHVCELETLRGRPPTPLELRVALRRPGV